jgi:hypothetical protein
MNIIDRAIAGLFPVWGAKRALARYALRSYDASNTAERLRARKPPLVTGPIEEGRLNREKLAAIARDLDRNNSWAHGVFNSLANNIVGSGFKPQATIRKRRGNGLDQKTNDRIEDAWRRWADSADITGKRSIYDLQWNRQAEHLRSPMAGGARAMGHGRSVGDPGRSERRAPHPPGAGFCRERTPIGSRRYDAERWQDSTGRGIQFERFGRRIPHLPATSTRTIRTIHSYQIQPPKESPPIACCTYSRNRELIKLEASVESGR